MGKITEHRTVTRIAAVFSRNDDAFDWAKNQMTDHWGTIRAESRRFAFTETKFYEASMGDRLFKQLFAFDDLMDPGTLARSKTESNEWEAQYQREHSFPEARPLNIDPGYVTEAKLVLATTKDRDHRIYLKDGIFAEVTLYYHRHAWCSRPWTYPDYQREEVVAFLDECRNDLRVRYNRSSATGGS